MKRTLPAVFLAALAAAVILIVAAPYLFNSSRRKALSAYLNFYDAAHRGTRLLSLVQAGRPQAFTPAMSARVIGDSSAFHTDLTYAGQARGADSLRPPPYPPADLSCALLGTPTGRTVIFIALHQEGGKADWLVHEASHAWPGEAIGNDLAAVGCSFVVDPQAVLTSGSHE